MTKAQVIVELERAHAELCAAVQRQWDGEHALKISIPARPGHDTDLVIGDAITQAIAALAASRSPERSAPPEPELEHAANSLDWYGQKAEQEGRHIEASVMAQGASMIRKLAPQSASVPPPEPVQALPQTECPHCAATQANLERANADFEAARAELLSPEPVQALIAQWRADAVGLDRQEGSIAIGEAIAYRECALQLEAKLEAALSPQPGTAPKGR